MGFTTGRACCWACLLQLASCHNGYHGVEGSFDFPAECYLDRPESLREPEVCDGGSFLPQPQGEAEGNGFSLKGRISCRLLAVEEVPWESENSVMENGYPVTADVSASTMESLGGIRDWVHAVALCLAVSWIASTCGGLVLLLRCWREKDMAQGAQMATLWHGAARQAASLGFVSLWCWAAWGSPRRAGWFYMPYCDSLGADEVDPWQYGLAHWAFIHSFTVHGLLSFLAALVQTVFLLRIWLPENTIYLPRGALGLLLREAYDAAPGGMPLRPEDGVPHFTWENGGSQDLHLNDWEQVVGSYATAFLVVEIRIRPADSFSEGSIEASSCSFSLTLRKLTPAVQGQACTFRVLLRNSFICQRSLVVNLFLPVFLANLLMLGFVHEIILNFCDNLAVSVRIDKWLRIEPNAELPHLCGHAPFTYNHNQILRVREFRNCAVEAVATVPSQVFARKSSPGNLNFVVEDDDEEFSAGVSNERWNKGSVLKEDWDRLISTADKFMLRSFLAIADREKGPRPWKHAEEFTRSLVHCWESSSFDRKCPTWKSIFVQAKALYNREFRQALACVDAQRMDELQAAASSPLQNRCVSPGRSLMLLDDFSKELLCQHICRSLEVARDIGDRKVLAIAMIECSRVDEALADQAKSVVDVFGEAGGEQPQLFREHGSSFDWPRIDDNAETSNLGFGLSQRLIFMGRGCSSSSSSSCNNNDNDNDNDHDNSHQNKNNDNNNNNNSSSSSSSNNNDNNNNDKDKDNNDDDNNKTNDNNNNSNKKNNKRSSSSLSNSSGGASQRFRQDFIKAREMYRQKLFADTQQVLVSSAGIELLGPDHSSLRETWLRQQLSVSRSRKASGLEARSKDEVDSPALLRSFQAFFDLTWRQVSTRDRHGKMPCRLKVIKARRSVNLDAYTAYCARRAEILASPPPRPNAAGESTGDLDDCVTASLTGSWTKQVIRDMQGAWTEEATGTLWIVTGPKAVKAFLIAAELLDPNLTEKLQDSAETNTISAAEPKEPMPKAGGRASKFRAFPKGLNSSGSLSGLLPMPDLVWSFHAAASAPRSGTPTPRTQQGWLSDDYSRVTWQCQETGAERVWVRDSALLGTWIIDNCYARIFPVCTFARAAEHLDNLQLSMPLQQVISCMKNPQSRRGKVWFAREVEQFKAQGSSEGELEPPGLLMAFNEELYPLWNDGRDEDKFNFRSITFCGHASADGGEICVEPALIQVSPEKDRQSKNSMMHPMVFVSSPENSHSLVTDTMPKCPEVHSASVNRANLNHNSHKMLYSKTPLGQLKSFVVFPFRIKQWGYRQVMVVDLSVKELSQAANEAWLFHGTREAAAESIADNEFQLKLAGTHRGTMFGPGIYLADSVTKSDEYSEADPTGLRTMLLCRAVMGNILNQSEGGRTCMKLCQSTGYHSVKGHRAYKEYVVYDENQLYAEYIIWYRRVYKST